MARDGAVYSALPERAEAFVEVPADSDLNFGDRLWGLPPPPHYGDTSPVRGGGKMRLFGFAQWPPKRATYWSHAPLRRLPTILFLDG